MGERLIPEEARNTKWGPEGLHPNPLSPEQRRALLEEEERLSRQSLRTTYDAQSIVAVNWIRPEIQRRREEIAIEMGYDNHSANSRNAVDFNSSLQQRYSSDEEIKNLDEIARKKSDDPEYLFYAKLKLQGAYNALAENVKKLSQKQRDESDELRFKVAKAKLLEINQMARIFGIRLNSSEN
jgi:hypothetical protein